MEITLVALDLPGDSEALLHFMRSNDFPFHANTAPSREDIEKRMSDGVYDGAGSTGFWVEGSEGRIGLVMLHDLLDPVPMFDLRLTRAARGRGLGVPVLRELVLLVFTRWPSVNRFEGQTREDNIAMRKTFLRCGFVKEAHYREGWPVAGSTPVASVGYGILRRDWTTGETTPFAWDDIDA